MNIIEISMGEKKHKISCNPGEENHIMVLSKRLNSRYEKLSKTLGHKASEELILVIIGLMLEDEVATYKEDNHSKNTIPHDKIINISNKIDDTIAQLENLKVS